MQKAETSWRKDGDWKARYSKIYSARRISIIGNEFPSCSTSSTCKLPKEAEPRRISFMSNDSTPYTSLLMRVRANRYDSTSSSETPSPRYLTSLLSQRSEVYDSCAGSQNMHNNDLGGKETALLNMVRARSKELQEEAQDQTLELPHEDVSDDQLSEGCVHGLNIRTTERSVSRSRVSRISTRRDMDIPSILAFTTPATPAPAQLEIPAFQKVNSPQREQIPRWSIRRAVCPVCSQKWRDRSSITNVKCSGLKRNLTSELPSVIAPARIRTSVTLGYIPRPVIAALDAEAGLTHGAFRNSSATWQLTRARRFRAPKLQMPPPEATAPPVAAAPTARKDLDLRVNRFLTDENIKKFA